MSALVKGYGAVTEGYQALNTALDSNAPTGDRVKAAVKVVASGKVVYETVKPVIDATGEHIAMRAHRAHDEQYNNNNKNYSFVDDGTRKVYEFFKGPIPPPPPKPWYDCCPCTIM